MTTLLSAQPPPTLTDGARDAAAHRQRLLNLAMGLAHGLHRGRRAWALLAR
jgi:hypothetical protein